MANGEGSITITYGNETEKVKLEQVPTRVSDQQIADISSELDSLNGEVV